jgi:hypothetical protein
MVDALHDANRIFGLLAQTTAGTPVIQPVVVTTDGRLEITGTVGVTSGGGAVALTTVIQVNQILATSSTVTTVLSTGALTVGVIVQALAANTAIVVIGTTTTTFNAANGFELQAGQATSVATSNLNNIGLSGSSANGVCWIGS